MGTSREYGSITPGIWEFIRDQPDDPLIVQTTDGQVICRVYDANDFPCLEEGTEEQADDEAISNAKLIAAAPALLRAVKGAYHALRSYQHQNASPELAKDWADICESAIARAGGAAASAQGAPAEQAGEQ